VIPDVAILQAHWRRLFAEQKAVKAFEKIRKQFQKAAKAATLPTDLEQRVAELLKQSPELSWDQAIALHLVKE
jgi:hypothetical protein